MSNPQTTTSLEELRVELRGRIEECISRIEETKRELGKGYDQNSYGAGYDEGEINGLKFTLAFMGEE